MKSLRRCVKFVYLALPIALILVTGCGSLAPATSQKTLTSITITPSNTSIAVNANEQLTATGNYSDGSTANLSSSVTWASSNQAIAKVSETGIATGVGAGSTMITTSMSGVTGSTGVTVTAATVTITGIAVTPATAGIIAGCDSAVHGHCDL